MSTRVVLFLIERRLDRSLSCLSSTFYVRVDRINVNLRVPSFCTKRFLYVEAFKINTKMLL